MSQSSKLFSFVYLISVLIVAAFARPQSSMDNSQELSDYQQPSLPELRKFYTALNSIQQEETPLDRLQMQLLANMAGSQMNNPGAYGQGAEHYDQLLRMPESKRAGRYRQCYFNPISCFRK